MLEDQERYQKTFLAESSAAMRAIREENEFWSALLGGNKPDQGHTLDDAKEMSAKLREAMANPWMKRGQRLKSTFVWSGGIHYDGFSSEKRGRRGPTVQEFIDDPANRRNYFCSEARNEREAALYTDAHVFVVGETLPNGRKTVRSVSLHEIENVWTSPEYPDEVWAYLRAYEHQLADGTTETRREWIYHNDFIAEAEGVRSLPVDNQDHPVSTTKVMFGRPVNRLIGNRWGLPDSIQAWQWIAKYRDGIMDGLTMQKAMSSIAYTVTTSSATGGTNASAVVGGLDGKAGTYVQGQGNSLAAVATAGKGYDFASLRPILAAAAAGLEVSLASLASDPGAAGSYSAAASLSLPDKLAVIDRRQYHIDLDREILVWAGAKVDDIRVWFNPLDDASEVYRRMQSVALAWSTGTQTPETIAQMIVEIFGTQDKINIPDGVLIPNNKETAELGNAPGTDGTPAQAGGAGQGQSNGTGGQGGTLGDDINTSSAESLLSTIAAEGLSDKLDELITLLRRD